MRPFGKSSNERGFSWPETGSHGLSGHPWRGKYPAETATVGRYGAQPLPAPYQPLPAIKQH